MGSLESVCVCGGEGGPELDLRKEGRDLGESSDRVEEGPAEPYFPDSENVPKAYLALLFLQLLNSHPVGL